MKPPEEVVFFLTAWVAAAFVHRTGHWLTALRWGHNIKFRLTRSKYNIPRFLWDMPDIEPAKQRSIAAAGFGLEFFVAWLLALFYPSAWTTFYNAVATLHICLYPLYAGEDSDFKWF